MSLSKPLLAGFLLLNAGLGAQASDLEVHYKVRGLAPAQAASPACIDAKTAAVGEISDQFCGSLGIELYNAGVIGDHAVLYGLSDDAKSVRWGVEYQDVPGVPNCTSASGCLGFTDGKAYSAAMAEHASTKAYAVSACTSKGEGWYVPAYAELLALYQSRTSPNYARLNIPSQDPCDYTRYWSSTEAYSNGSGVWSIRLGGGHSSMYSKTSNLQLRCARGG